MRSDNAALLASTLYAPSAPTVAPYLAQAGGLGIEIWHSQLGVSQSTAGNAAVAWKGQIASTLVSAPGVPNRPAYGPVGSKGGGKPAVQTAVSGAKCLIVSGLPTLAASGTKPWLYVRGCWANASIEVNGTIVDFGALAVSDDIIIRSGDTNGAPNKISLYSPIVEGPAYDTNMHSMHAWKDGTSQNFKVDSTLYTVAHTFSITHNITAIGFGRAASGNYQLGTASAWLIFLLSAYPGATIAAAIDALATAEFPA